MELEDTTPSITRTRIHVGGLGGSVTEDEVKKIFTSVGGIVEGVEIIRTKGRSFAYIDFLPSSDKSLPKLFSTYNGCMWKGGRLRLEKAKEHYLVRLRSEWAEEEDARQQEAQKQDAQQQDASEKRMQSSQISKRFTKNSLDDKQIRIFFPRLNKVKSLLFSGSGKHRYSFPRVEVPSHQKHFCDCEEHSVPTQTVTKKQISEQQAEGDGINEEELTMMNSVMNKLFEKEYSSNVVNSGTRVAKEEDNSLKLMDDIQSDENEADEDNLIINVVTQGNNKIKQQTDFMNQDSRFHKKRPSEDYPTENSHEVQKMNIVPPKKKVKFLLDEESHKNDSFSDILGGKESSQDHLNALWPLLPTKTESGIKRSTTNLSWSQKSSWIELVGNRDNSAFSVTHILPSSASGEREQPKSEDLKAFSPNNESYSSSEEEQPKSEDLNISDSPNDENYSCSEEEQPKFEDPNMSNSPNNSPSDESCTSSEKEQAESEDLNVSSPNNETQNLASHENLEVQSVNMQAVESITEAQPTKPTADSNKSGRGAAWLQQASWTQLVTEKNTSFSISQILPGISFKHQELPETNAVDGANSADNKNSEGHKPLEHGNMEFLTPRSSNVVAMGKEPNFAGSDALQTASEKNLHHVVGSTEGSASVLEKNRVSTSKQASIGDARIGETCSFMRSADSLKEWANAKAALSGSLKSKSNEK